MYQLSGKIKCLGCGKNFRGKKYRNKNVYICSGYSNGQTECELFKIDEEELLYTISKHLAILGRRVEGSLGEHVHIVEVKERSFTIYYTDGSKSIIEPNRLIY